MGKRKRDSKSQSETPTDLDLDTKNNPCTLDDEREILEEDEEDFPGESDSKRLKTSDDVTASAVDPNVSYEVKKYAPKLPTYSGEYELYCASIIWNDHNDGAGVDNVRNMGNHINKTYRALSDGALRYNVHAMEVKVNLPRKPSNVASAERTVKRVMAANNGSKPKRFAIVTNGAISRSHASNETAHLINALNTTGAHETGHLEGLEHSNRMVTVTKGKKKGKKEIQRSRDGTSVMSIYSSDKLTAPQMDAKGWFAENKVAQHELDFPPTVYKLQPVFSKEEGEHLNAVQIPRPGKPLLYLSLCKLNQKSNGFSLALHTKVGKGGSTRQEVFGQHAEFDGMSFDKVSEDGAHWQVKVSPTLKA